MEAEWLSGRSGGHLGTVAAQCCDIQGVTHWGGAGTALRVHFCLSVVGSVSLGCGAELKRAMGELSPLGSHPLLLNPHCWIPAMAWWFGLFVSYKVQPHRT